MKSDTHETGRGIKLMAHLVAGFPDLESSYQVARGLVDGGADLIELQFPFSDPSADGKPIQEACGAALEAGFRLADGFKLAERIGRDLGVPVFLMSYGNPVFAMGVKRFVEKTAEAGAEGIIAPDLMPGADEGLYRYGRAGGVRIVPVFTPRISAERLTVVLAEEPSFLYCALRNGITGDGTRLDAENISFLDRLRKTGVVVGAGFGIVSRLQMEELRDHADVGIAGSVFVRDILAHRDKSPEQIYRAVKQRAESLKGLSREGKKEAGAESRVSPGE